MFSNIFATAEEGTSDPPVRFLTRYDKSATNIKDSQLWIGIGQVPWATAYSKWYHQYIAYPIQALTAAILLDEYTITDRGTYLSISTQLQNQTTIYKAATMKPRIHFLTLLICLLARMLRMRRLLINLCSGLLAMRARRLSLVSEMVSSYIPKLLPTRQLRSRPQPSEMTVRSSIKSIKVLLTYWSLTSIVMAMQAHHSS